MVFLEEAGFENVQIYYKAIRKDPHISPANNDFYDHIGISSGQIKWKQG